MVGASLDGVLTAQLLDEREANGIVQKKISKEELRKFGSTKIHKVKRRDSLAIQK